MNMRSVFKQRSVGRSWGYLVQTASQAAVFITVINFFMLAGTFFAVAVAPFFQEKGIVMPFWLFLAILIIPIAIAGVILFKFAVPSFFSAFSEQFYKHDNPIKRDMDELKTNCAKILERMEALENKR